MASAGKEQTLIRKEWDPINPTNWDGVVWEEPDKAGNMTPKFGEVILPEEANSPHSRAAASPSAPSPNL